MNNTLVNDGAGNDFAGDAADARLLHAISIELITEGNGEALYEKIIDAAMSIMRSDFASMQMLHAERNGGELELLAFRGFTPQAARFWKWIRSDSTTTCGMALRERRRVITADVEKCTVIAGSSDLETFLGTGIRSAQTTPLISRAGKLVGMLSTHWRKPHVPDERELRLLDILARQAADLIERHQAEAALHASAEALRAADRRKNDFLAILAHELRNPLATIRNAPQILRLSGGDFTVVQTIARMLERQIGLMVRMVDDLLDVNRIERGKLELRRETTDLATILRQAVEVARPMLDSRNQRLSVAIPEVSVPLFADPARLTQAVANLLNNASKFAPAQGEVRLQAEASHDTVTIRVQDDGVGIDPDHLPRIFELFAQVDAAVDRKHGGLGIGLTLVKTFVEMHGGHITARSAGLGKGSEFTIWLPLAAMTA